MASQDGCEGFRPSSLGPLGSVQDGSPADEISRSPTACSQVTGQRFCGLTGCLITSIP